MRKSVIVLVANAGGGVVFLWGVIIPLLGVEYWPLAFVPAATSANLVLYRWLSNYRKAVHKG